MRIMMNVLGFVVSVPLLSSQGVAGSEVPTSRSIAAPLGFSSACARYDWLCHGRRSGRLDDGQALRVLQQVNRYVNASVTPAEEPGKSFYWSAGNIGDCKNYALLKMRTLIGMGFPSNKLALSVVLDRSGSNHMVLLARLNSGDYVLDNLSGGVKPWHRTGYTFLVSQNFKRKGSWQVTLAGPRAGQFYED
ncbi:hypothetical protein A6U87_06305 [Rhizobium sp. AC44/96]|uniref:transglutaminase-like cysteine peptidase n=1 Tax=Rhizobium sp. AC44/96 TaxID=1841654 RepID=UPI00080FD7EB|nr:transglutaminase-like cysteine peptidase [Rhizobium sp. AC44/96]OCJ12917.1 hypothetical protein A6U87_06305 [Rhizobium sp. AC44/96]